MVSVVFAGSGESGSRMHLCVRRAGSRVFA
jgi:hypothetical protein